MYTEKIKKSLNKVTANRETNIFFEPNRMTAEEKSDILLKFHPDYKKNKFTKLKVGVNKGDFVPKELAQMLQSHSRITPEDIDLKTPNYNVDVLVIGGGGAGACAAIEAHNAGAKVMLITKLRFGDSNTIMAEGGIQAADKENDSPVIHFLDTYGGGNYIAKRELVSKLVTGAPEAIKWLSDLGVEFDKMSDGTMITTSGGGTSRKRMHSAKDYSGLEIMRTLRDEVFNLNIEVLEYTAAIELILDETNSVAGAVLFDMESKHISVVKAKTVIIATGGAGRIHYQGFPTTNHYGATADGLVLGYRAGANLINADSLQYHPTGVAFPEQLLGSLVTEKSRSLGAKLINAKGEVFIHSLETRDVTTAAIIKECTEKSNGIDIGKYSAIWLDTPMIDIINGTGTIEKNLPAMFRMFSRFGIDIRKEPVLIYPTLHYQNGGLEINDKCATTNIKNLFVVGEVAGGIHGKNRLMGNSLLEIIVFGRTAGYNAATLSKKISLKNLTLNHIKNFEKEIKCSQIKCNTVSPKLLPNYTNKKH